MSPNPLATVPPSYRDDYGRRGAVRNIHVVPAERVRPPSPRYSDLTTVSRDGKTPLSASETTPSRSFARQLSRGQPRTDAKRGEVVRFDTKTATRGVNEPPGHRMKLARDATLRRPHS